MSKIKLTSLGSAKRLTRSAVTGKYREPLNQILFIPQA